MPIRAALRGGAIACLLLAIAAGAILCGMRGYKAICDWADALGQKARMRFGCRRENGQKRTNEIGMAIPLLEGCDIAGKDITGDALLTQRALASYILERQAHYHFTVKGNHPGLQRDIALLLKAFITASTGTTMRIAAASVPASARKTSPACVASRWASSSPSRNRLNPSPS